MRSILEPFLAEHGVEIMGPASKDCLNFLLRCQYEGPGFTARLEDGRILGSAGCIEELPYSATGWLIPTPHVQQYPVLFHRLVLHGWADILRTHKWRRVQTIVDPTFPERIRWIERLGFVREGCQRAGGDHGQDLWYYGWLRENGHGTSGNRHRSRRSLVGVSGSGSLRGVLVGTTGEKSLPV